MAARLFSETSSYGLAEGPGDSDWKGSPPVQSVFHEHEEYSWTSSTGGFSRMVVQYSGAKNATGWNDADFDGPGGLRTCQLVSFVVITIVLTAIVTSLLMLDRLSRDQ
ncbi:hypothetical protein Moror_16877 [Moniliophthora roreri MCA 2997]|uniref:Uncharacterized protein n=2 Tax=Moniliophthora roreri TaxID=221103 RepID=V2XAB6_MONRO|nr:hypothetical protein Moror_16877 [Moniliophthora roreri MCA 2997]